MTALGEANRARLMNVAAMDDDDMGILGEAAIECEAGESE